MSRFYEMPEHSYKSNYNESEKCNRSIIDLSRVARLIYFSDNLSCEIVFDNGFSINANKLEAEKVLKAWKEYASDQDNEKLKLENEMLKQMLRDQINGKLETAKLLKEVLEK